MQEISLRPKSVAKIFLVVSLIMVVGHIGGRISYHYFGRTFGFYFFDLNREDSIPTFVASMQIFVCSVLLFVIARLVRMNKQPGFWYWVGLAVMFLYIAVDETVRIHEKLGGPLRRIYDPAALYDMVWLVPYVTFVIIIGLIYLKFVLNLPRKTKLLFILSGLIYLAGAVAFEYISGRQDALYGIGDFGYQAFIVLEEGLELMGIVLFLYALLNHIVIAFDGLRFTIPALENKDSP